MRNEINDFIYLAYSDGSLSYETIFCSVGRHCFDFLNGWRFYDADSALASGMVSDEFGIWWDINELKEFVEALENQ
jgi:hypothetical protein